MAADGDEVVDDRRPGDRSVEAGAAMIVARFIPKTCLSREILASLPAHQAHPRRNQRCFSHKIRFGNRVARHRKHRVPDGSPRCTRGVGRTRGGPRKIQQPAELAEAIDQVRPRFHYKPRNVSAGYRACVKRAVPGRERVAPNTFRRLVKQYELLKPDAEAADKRRLAFAKAHANEMWQADTMFGPYVGASLGKAQPSSSLLSTVPAALLISLSTARDRRSRSAARSVGRRGRSHRLAPHSREP